MKKRISINYVCVSRLLGSNDFVLLKERIDLKKLLKGNSFPFSYYDLSDDLKTKYDRDDIEEAYNYRDLLNYKRNVKHSKEYLLTKGLKKAKMEIDIYKRHGINGGAKLK